MNKQTSILVAFALAFFVAFALTTNEILSNDNLKTEITTSDKSTENTCSSKTEKSCCSRTIKLKKYLDLIFLKKMITPLTRKQTVILRNLIVAQQQLQKNHVAAQKLQKNDQK